MFALRLKVRVVCALLAVACIAPVATVTHGAEVLLSGFETDQSTSIPGVSWTNGAHATTQIATGIVGTSEGTSVLQVEHAALWNGTDPFVRISGQDVARAISESTALKFDIIAPQDFAWRQAFVVMHGAPVDWNATQTQFNLDVPPETPFTVEFDLTKDYADRNGVMRPLNEIALEAFDQPESDWFEVLIIFQGQDNLPLDTSITYLDNIRLVQPDVVGVNGDYNNDGSVDAADYVAWRDNGGAPAGTLPNDPTGVAIGPEQYNVWRQNFGAGGAGGAGSLAAAAVPEPGAFSLGVLMLMAIASFHARFSSKTR